ncbi:MAG: enoyl-CoA hydratase [Actinobacteria bacterium]|nr:enoyl-CoA hydratase [Actinomycetota bacterium]
MSEGTTDEVVLAEVSDGIATITLNRPEARNAINGAMGARLPEVVAEMDARDDVAVMILTGTDPAFCAGADLKDLGSREGTGTDAMSVYDDEGRLPYRGPFAPRTKVLIGAVNGPAITGGFEIALNCDFLVASDRARFADTHARVGILPGWGLTVLLCQSVGVRRARELSATGNYLSAEQALTWGLVNHVVAHEELLPFTRELATAVAGNNGQAVGEMMRLYDRVVDVTGDEAWDLEAAVNVDWMRRMYDPAAIAARRDAVVERGRAQFRG